MRARFGIEWINWMRDARGDSAYERGGMLVVSLRGVNFGF